MQRIRKQPLFEKDYELVHLLLSLQYSKQSPHRIRNNIPAKASRRIRNNIPHTPKEKKPPKRHRTSIYQLEMLTKLYEVNKIPDLHARAKLSLIIDMSSRRIQVWFQNRRAKEKRLTDVDLL